MKAIITILIMTILPFQLIMSQPTKEITVVSDDNYPPYIFRDSEGNLQGIIPDMWTLWQEETGVKVNLIAMEWGSALKLMKEGKADVIETIFFTEERAKIYDFTQPYATLNVPIFHNKEISGITSYDNLTGFTIGVKAGDACIDQLKSHNITNLKEYPSYEEVVKAAKEKQIHIFCVDEPPALYFLYKYNIKGDFNTGFNLDSGEFHRAVAKGNKSLLFLIEDGFSKISKNNYEKINEKWFGEKLSLESVKKFVPYLVILAIIVSLIFLNLVIMSITLQKKVKNRTKELNNTLETLSESQERYKALLDANPDLMFMFTEDGSFIDYKSQQESKLYLPPDEFVGRNIKEILPPLVTDLTFKAIERCKQSGELQNFEYQLEYDSIIGFFDARMAKVGVNKYLAIVRDITEKKRSDEDRFRSHKLESLGILAGGIAHDFNNILTAILGSISLVKNNLITDEFNYSLLDDAEKASMRAKSLTTQLLTFAKGGNPIKESTNINQIIKDSAEFILRGSSVLCEFYLESNLYTVEADKGQISQVIQNLVLNSVQAMPGGGVIKIFTQKLDLHSPNTYSMKDGKYIKIQISDTGIGIPENYITSIFDPYFSSKKQGTGLGLTISYSIIQKHCGFITVESKPGEGTTFTIILPAQEDMGKAEDKPSFLSKLSLNERILIMDDEPMILRTVSKMLTQLGAEVVTALHGEEALTIYRDYEQNNKGFDLVIMDLTIPGKMGGREAIKHLLTEYPNAVVIVASGYSNDEVMANFETFGFKGMIVKPYNMQELVGKIKEVLRNNLKLKNASGHVSQMVSEL